MKTQSTQKMMFQKIFLNIGRVLLIWRSYLRYSNLNNTTLIRCSTCSVIHFSSTADTRASPRNFSCSGKRTVSQKKATDTDFHSFHMGEVLLMRFSVVDRSKTTKVTVNESRK
uniref:Uncharacterized protein n=1 Tax=Romanomermis culicivorax TaxID=13658 RepID=A0A915KQR3_ROMCU